VDRLDAGTQLLLEAIAYLTNQQKAPQKHTLSGTLIRLLLLSKV